MVLYDKLQNLYQSLHFTIEAFKNGRFNFEDLQKHPMDVN